MAAPMSSASMKLRPTMGLAPPVVQRPIGVDGLGDLHWVVAAFKSVAKSIHPRLPGALQFGSFALASWYLAAVIG
jgi:uncharacterized protein (DUF2236 family)